MRDMKVGDRVKTKHEFLSDGEIIDDVGGLGYIVKLDKKAPNEYAWDTYEVLMFEDDVELIE